MRRKQKAPPKVTSVIYTRQKFITKAYLFNFAIWHTKSGIAARNNAE